MIRTSEQRWQALSMLLASVEKCIEANARLDALVKPEGRRGRPAIDRGGEVTVRLDVASAAVLREMNRLTAERLTFDLQRKKEVAA